jgi:PadR family transcriptional regulator, regulatory protein PadR
MGSKNRLSHRRLLILQQYRGTPEKEYSGADLMRLTGLFSGTLYPALYALEDANFLTSTWEAGDPSTLGRPRKRLYRITGLGRHAANEAMAELGSPVVSLPIMEEGSR